MSYKTRSLAGDDDTTHHIAFPLSISIPVPTAMRLTVLALFIALPALAYGAVTPQQRAPDSDSADCESSVGRGCLIDSCCWYLKCSGGFFPVCLVAPFALFHVGVLSSMQTCEEP